MSAVTEAAAALVGATPESYRLSVAPLLFALLSGPRSPDKVEATLVRLAVRVAGTSELRMENVVAEAGRWSVLDWMTRTVAPTWWKALGLESEADRLQRLPPVTPATSSRAISTLNLGRIQVSNRRDAARDTERPLASAARTASDTAWFMVGRHLEEVGSRAVSLHDADLSSRVRAAAWDPIWASIETVALRSAPHASAAANEQAVHVALLDVMDRLAPSLARLLQRLLRMGVL